MRVTRHPYEVEGWGVGELWIGDGKWWSPRSADARRPLHGAAASRDASRRPTHRERRPEREQLTDRL